MAAAEEARNAGSAHVTVARIVRAHGRKGEVAAEILTDFPARLTALHSVYLWDGRSEPSRPWAADNRGAGGPVGAGQVGVRSCWLSQSRGGQAIFHFEGCDSIGAAEKMAGLEVRIPREERAALPCGSYYVSDLIGCEARTSGGNLLGRVRDVQFTGEEVAGTPILVLDSPRGEALIPLAQEICVRIDTAAREIEVAPPEGLLELNRERGGTRDDHDEV